MGFRSNNQKGRSSSRQVSPREERLPQRDVFSYHANRSARPSTTDRNDSSSVKVAGRPSPRPVWHLVPAFLASGMLLVGLGYAFLLEPTPKVRVTSTDNEAAPSLLRPKEEYTRAAQELLKSSVLNRNKITINTGELNRRMESRFPELAEANFVLPFLGHRPVLELRAARPALVLVSAAQNKTYLLDSSGRVLLASDAIAKEGTAKGLPAVNDDSNLPIEQGKNILPKQTVDFLTTVYSQLNTKNIAVESMTLPSQPNRLHIKLAGRPYYLKFSLLMDPKQASGSALAVLQKFDAEHITPAQYIDLRTEERVFYL